MKELLLEIACIGIAVSICVFVLYRLVCLLTNGEKPAEDKGFPASRGKN